MANNLMEYLAGRKPQNFQPHPYYSKDGDFLTYFFRGDDHVAERKDDILTVYRSMDGGEFVGFKLKGVHHLLKTLGEYRLDVFDGDGELMLSLLVIAGMTLTQEPDALPFYQQIARDTRQVPLNRRELLAPEPAVAI